MRPEIERLRGAARNGSGKIWEWSIQSAVHESV